MTTVPVSPEYEHVADHAHRRNVDAGLILGICSLATSLWPVIGFILGVLGVIFAGKSVKKITPNSGYKGIGVVGLTTSIIGLILGLFSTLAWLGYMGYVSGIWDARITQ